MKFYKFNCGAIEECTEYPSSHGMGILSFSECDKLGLDLNYDTVKKISSSKYTTYERRECYQYIVLNTPTTKSYGGLFEKILIYMDMRGTLIFSENADRLSGVVGDFSDKLSAPTLAHFLSGFLSALLAHDYIYIEGIEKDLGKVETEILSQHTPNYAEKINGYRRKVAVIKRYYEQLYEVVSTLLEEDFLSEAYAEFEKIKQKLERLREEALYLRDYMSQVREAYQQAVDLSLNSVMKFLSAVTLMFSPLTFLVGWYGMNFDIPETKSAYGYALPFALTAIVIMVTVFIFKKKKWL